MSASINVVKFTDRDIDVIVSCYEDVYKGRWSVRYEESFRNFMTSRDFDSWEEAAEIARNFVWSFFAGGGVSADATRKAFTAIGKGWACNDNWI